MYIETALKRLNAFHQDTRCDVRFSFPTTYMDEPYAAYSWGEILQLAACYPHVADTDGKGNDIIHVQELGITICPANRSIVESKDGYMLVTQFHGKTRLPLFILSTEDGEMVYTRVPADISVRCTDDVVVKGVVVEEWYFKGATGRQPKSLQQAYFIEDMPSGEKDRTKVGKVTITYTSEHNKVIEEGTVTYRKGFSSEYDYYRESYSVFDDDSLIVRHQPGNRVVCLLDNDGVVRKTYDGEFMTIIKWFDASGKPIRKGKLEFVTHSFELQTSKVDNALRRSGASEFDDRYPSIESKFFLKCCPAFPVPAKEQASV
ncbi:MAG: hypothetical protein IKA48_00365 [Fibrobacter sp.]|nr:hypothetical protein [Fibrobacter sp.]